MPLMELIEDIPIENSKLKSEASTLLNEKETLEKMHD